MADIQVVPEGFRLVGDDGGANRDFQLWMENVTTAIRNLAPITGTGTPETFQTASIGRWYVDTAEIVGEGIYFKETGDENTGWVKRS